MLNEIRRIALVIFHAPRLFLARLSYVEPGECDICHEPLDDLSQSRCETCWFDMQY